MAPLRVACSGLRVACECPPSRAHLHNARAEATCPTVRAATTRLHAAPESRAATEDVEAFRRALMRRLAADALVLADEDAPEEERCGPLRGPCGRCGCASARAGGAARALVRVFVLAPFRLFLVKAFWSSPLPVAAARSRSAGSFLL